MNSSKATARRHQKALLFAVMLLLLVVPTTGVQASLLGQTITCRGSNGFHVTSRRTQSATELSLIWEPLIFPLTLT